MNNYTNNNTFTKTLLPLLVIIFGSLMLQRLSYINGFPLTMGDSGGYITRAFSQEINHHWALFYSLFIRVFSLGESLWWVAVVQNFILSFLIFRIFTLVFDFSLKTSIYFIISLVILYFASTLPYFSNLLMSDIFLSIGVLVLVCILLLPRLNAEVIFYGLLLAMGVLAHISHIVIILGIVFVLILMTLISHFRGSLNIKKVKPKIAFITISLLIASYIFSPIVNSFFYKPPLTDQNIKVEEDTRISNSRYHFVWVTLIGNQKLYQYFLDKNCQKKQYEYLCNPEKMKELSSDKRGLKDDFHGHNADLFYEMEDAGKAALFDLKILPFFLQIGLKRISKVFDYMGPPETWFRYAKHDITPIYNYLPKDKILIENSKSYFKRFLPPNKKRKERKKIRFFSYFSILIILTLPLLSFFQKEKDKIYSKVAVIALLFLSAYTFNCLLFAMFGNIHNTRYSSRASWLLLFAALLIVCYYIDYYLIKKYYKNN